MPSRQLLNASSSTPTTTIIFLTITAFASLIILFAIIYFLYYLYYSLVHRSRTSPFDSATPLAKLQRFTYKELKSATNGFNATNIIGKGGSGTVFGGILKDGKLVAIKLLDSNSLQSEREFQNELQILGWLRRSQLIVTLLGYSVEKSKRLVVYEYMPNKSLQESLFSECDYTLSWCKRFDIILDIANALSFLHIECDPPVIHGDVKPSNVLLDSDYRAKLSDFGLARLKLDGEFGVDMFSQDLGKSQDLWKSQELSGNLSIEAGGGGEGETPAFSTPKRSHDEVDFAMALQASSSSKGSRLLSHTVVKSLALNSFNCKGNVVSENACEGKNVVKGKGISSVENGGEDWSKIGNYDDELSSIDHSKELNLNAGILGDENPTKGAKQWGKDWWWRQEGSAELCSKDYVMEWIGSQICSSTSADWEEERRCSNEKSNLENSMPLDKFEEVNETQLGDCGIECTKNDVTKEGSERWKLCNKKHRKMQEWWKEEHFDELSRKSKSKRTEVNTLESKFKKRMKVPHFGLRKRFHFRRRKLNKENRNIDEGDREFSFRRGCSKKNSPSFGSDMWSGDLFSRELSSTTSMRGTLCYVAPEYGGCGYLMEKSDIYSLGVLILVIVSGRRPLHVLSSPMKLEKANLISWCRNLAQSGNILELVDERLKDDYNKDQASLCINLALACIQKMPELRPDIGDVVKILKGEMELPPLPFEFSPSPPSKLFSRSRRKQKSSGDYNVNYPL